MRAQEQPIVQLSADKGLHHIGQHAYYFIDETGELTIEQVSTPDFDDKFIPTGKLLTTIGITEGACWIRLLIVTDADSWCLQVEPAMIDRIQLFKKSGDAWSVSNNGFIYPTSEREIKNHLILFSLEQNPGDTVEYYIRSTSYYPAFVMMRAGTESDFWNQQTSEHLLFGTFFGIMLLMALYNLFLFLTNRDRVYIYYVLYVLFSVVFISFSLGYAVYFPDIFRKIHNFNHIIYPFLFGIFGLLFSMRFLYTKKYAPRMHKVMWGLIVAVFFVVGIRFFNPHIATGLIQLMGLALTVISIAVGIVVYRAGYKPARYYLLGFGIYTLGLSAFIMVAVLSIELTEFAPSYFMMIAAAVEAIVLSFAIGDKLNVANRDKQIAQEARLKALQENEQLVREQNFVLERKVAERTREINDQKEIIEEKNKDILDSIHYAKRIQRALLASESFLGKHLRDYFILYKPKDIVSGDFYFAAEQDEKFWLCVGDCTGHGVPGAFMSLLNISIMRELIADQKLPTPDRVLNTQRDQIIRALNPDGATETKDGMDCALLCFDLKSKKLSMACANRPVWIVRNGELIEFRPDKQPVGVHEGVSAPFTLQAVELQKGDCIFAITDGFADQFGGPRGKKFKYSQLKEQLIAMRDLLMPMQGEKLNAMFDDWRGKLEQVDDVLLIGIRIQ